MNWIPRVSAVLLAAVLLCHCGVSGPSPCRSVPFSARHQDPAQLLGQAREAWQEMKDHGSAAAGERYHKVVAMLFDHLRCGHGEWDERARAIGTIVDRRGDLVDPDQLDGIIPASDVKQAKLDAHRTTPGVGVPAVGWKETTPVGTPRERFLLPNCLPYHLCVILDLDGPLPAWKFYKRPKVEDMRLGGRRVTLAADWSAPNEFFWRMCELDNLLLQNVVLPDRFTEETGLYFVQPYDPSKIPVVFVHGLVSSPDAFKNMINELAPEPWFRKHYQIWLYNYPTGNPWVYSAALFREKMREAFAFARSKGGGATLDRTVIICHSMGGLLTRSSVTDPGHALYDAAFTTELDDLPANARQRSLIRETLLYKPLKEPSRVVFLAVPHRGSPMATWGPSQWASRLIRLPKTLTVELLDSTLVTMSRMLRDTSGRPNLSSINSLSPHAPTTCALAGLPLPRDVKFHSIIGDRGKGDTPGSSDGVVPYWSSHVTPVASELIVPSNHSVPDSPQAAAEVRRILKLHLQQP